MKAFGHLVSGSAIGLAINITAINLTYLEYEPIRSFASSVATPQAISMQIGAIGTSLLYAFYFLGLLLPDCDSEDSFISNIIHLPFEHRTWTHSIWAVLLFVVAGFFYKPLWGLALGIFVHILMDSVSVSGVCWLYPITAYKTSFKTGFKPDKYTTGLEQETFEDMMSRSPDTPPPGWHHAIETYHKNPKHNIKLYDTDEPRSVAVVCGVLWALVVLYMIISGFLFWK